MNLRCVLFIVAIFSLNGHMSSAQVAESAVTDGPYVFYRGKEIVVAEIRKYDDLLTVKTDSYSFSERSKMILSVMPTGHPDWAFKVALKDKLLPNSAESAGNENEFYVSDIEGEFGALR